MPNINLSVLNQRQTPALYADTLANIPAAGYLGRIFYSTDTFAIYRDNGTGWDLFGGPGTGTVTGTGTTGQIAIWTGSSIISGTGTTGSGSVVLNNSPALTTPSFTSINVVGGVAAMPTGSGTLAYTSALSNYVPYTGANATVNLNTQQLDAGLVNLSSRLNVNGATDSSSFALNVLGDIQGSSGIVFNNGSIKSTFFAQTTIGTTIYSQNSAGSVYKSFNIAALDFSFSPNAGPAALGIDSSSITTLTASTYGILNLNSIQSTVWGCNMAFKANGTAFGYFGSIGSLLGSTVLDLSVYATAGNGYRVYTNGNNLRHNIDSTGIAFFNSRLNVNGATDNSLFALNVNGTVNGSSPSFTGNTYTVTGNLAQQFYHVFTGAVGQTLTVPTPSGNNSQYLIINNSANILTVAAFSGTNIITLIGTSSGTISLAANARVLLIADGNNKYYQAF